MGGENTEDWRVVLDDLIQRGLRRPLPREACVTVPTIAWPPSLTDTCCTVTFCSPPVR
jgi:hypothetical protein